MKKILGIVVLGLLLSGNAYATHDKEHFQKIFNSSCVGESDVVGVGGDIKYFVQDIRITIDYDHGKKQFFGYQIVDTNFWAKRPGRTIWPISSATLDLHKGVSINFDNEIGRFELKIKEFNKKLTGDVLYKNYSERLNLSTGTLLWNIEAITKNNKYIISVNAKCSDTNKAYEYLKNAKKS